jgi:hypothetical protein
LSDDYPSFVVNLATKTCLTEISSWKYNLRVGEAGEMKATLVACDDYSSWLSDVMVRAHGFAIADAGKRLGHEESQDHSEPVGLVCAWILQP